VVAAVVGGLVVHAARRQAESARARAEARMLADLSGASVGDDPMAVLLAQLRDAFDLAGAAVVRTGDGRIEAEVGALGLPDIAVALGPDHQLVATGRLLSAEDRGIVTVVADHLTAALRTRQLRVEASAAAALAEANELRTAILAAVSHDLRTPLASIKASVTSLRQDDVEWPPDAVAELLSIIAEETDRLDDLVGNLLDLSRLQTNTLQIQRTGRRPRGGGAGRPGQPRRPGRRRRPPRARDAAPRAGRPRAARAGAGQPRVERGGVVARGHPGAGRRLTGGERLDLRVVDHGPGIPLDARQRVFEPFQRLGDGSKDGVGLGLAVARGFVTAMGGQLVVEDTPGGGTTMVVSFPVAT
jgi:two-component system sensor histidine kinase KdpD